jgi:N-methylhydantoinase A/oxoprolinase/acetone carboxylase beta subunit
VPTGRVEIRFPAGLRVVSFGDVPGWSVEVKKDASGAIIGAREVWLPEAGGFVACPVYDRDRLAAGNRFTGPAIVEQMDATTVVLPGMTAFVEPYLNLILETVA